MKEIHRPETDSPVSTENSHDSVWPSGIKRLRDEVSTAIEYGKTVSGLASLIAIAGILYWCPRCGQWMGEGSEGRGQGAPKPNLPPPPRRLLRALGLPLEGDPTPTRDLPRRDGNTLTPNSGILEDENAKYGDKPAKRRYNPQSEAHGRKVDTYYDGFPKSDSRPHAHHSEFNRGDDTDIPIYHREKDRTIILDNGIDVVYVSKDNIYQWQPKPEKEQ